MLAGKQRALRYTAAALIRIERANPDDRGYFERTMLVLWEGMAPEDRAEFSSFEDFTERVTLQELMAASGGAGKQLKADGFPEQPEPSENPTIPAVA